MAKPEIAKKRPHLASQVAGDDYPWFHFVAASSPGAARWVDAFQANGGVELTNDIDGALWQLRSGDMAGGRRGFERARERIDELSDDGVPASMVSVLERWYHSGLAYLNYRAKRYADAVRALDAADRAIERAIEAEPFLIKLAGHCYDFDLQRARIKRMECRWPEMAAFIDEGRQKLHDRRPLCVAGSGPVFLRDLVRFYRGIQPRDEREAAALRELSDVDKRRQVFESFARDNLAIPWLIIPYP